VTKHFTCSNVGSALVGLAVEAATGTPFAEHVRTAVLEPLWHRSGWPG
jgi:D-alanyl-D-alanine carboxypeptidase